jgi:hypothetical protein
MAGTIHFIYVAHDEPLNQGLIVSPTDFLVKLAAKAEACLMKEMRKLRRGLEPFS